MSKIYFWSDTHFGHTNIAGPEVSNWPSGFRHYRSTKEMDNDLLDSINQVVGTNDILYHLGDFCFGDSVELYRRSIRCKNVILIRGNHDKQSRYELKQHFTDVFDLTQIRYKGETIVLCHYPLLVWNKHAHGSFHFHGHCHGNIDQQPRRIQDVGVDVLDKPAFIDDLIDLVGKRGIVALDHHGPNRDVLN